MKRGGHVYAIGPSWDAAVKIGVAVNISRRLMALQAGNHLTLNVLWTSARLADPYGLERHLHAAFSDTMVRGEWHTGLSLGLVESAAASFDDGEPMRRGIDDTSRSLSIAVRAMVEVAARRENISIEDAIKLVAERAGVTSHLIHVYRYRPPYAAMMSAYEPIARCLWLMAGLDDFGPRRNIPLPEQIIATAELFTKTLPATPARLALIAETEALLGSLAGQESRSSAGREEVR